MTISNLFNPSSIAIVGASAATEKWGYFLAKHALIGKKERPVYLVNRSAMDYPRSTILLVARSITGNAGICRSVRPGRRMRSGYRAGVTNG